MIIDDGLKNRFESKFEKINDEQCWYWLASTAGNGYGQIKLTGQRKQIYAHRVSYLLYKGEIPENMEVCHKCDDPLCVNPNHLFLGTRADNAQDMKQKGRSTAGEKSGTAKLNENDVKDIRVMLLKGVSQIKIAGLFGISQIQISRINTGKQWKA